MGYTHYWSSNERLSEEAWTKSLIWCGRGALLVPVVFSDGGAAKVISLGCVRHGSVPVQAGIVIEGKAPGVRP